MKRTHALWRGGIAALVLLAGMSARATVVVVPQVTNSGGANVPSIAAVPIDSTGAEKFTSGNPGVVTGGTSTTACGGVTCAKDASVTAVGAQLPATLGAKTSANSLSIAPASDATFTIGGYSFQLGSGDGTQAAITVQNAAYAATNAMGGWQTLPVARVAGGSGALNALSLTSVSGQAFSGFLFLYAKNPAGFCTDKVAFSPSSTDRPYEVPGSPFAFTTAVNTNSGSTAAKAVLTGLGAFFQNKDTSPTVNLYGCIVTSGSVTPGATTDLVLTESGTRD